MSFWSQAVDYMVSIKISLFKIVIFFMGLDCGLLTTCYKVVDLNRLVTSCNNLLSSCNSTTSQEQLDRISALLQLVDKLATSLLRKHLVDKL